MKILQLKQKVKTIIFILVMIFFKSINKIINKENFDFKKNFNSS